MHLYSFIYALSVDHHQPFLLLSAPLWHCTQSNLPWLMFVTWGCFTCARRIQLFAYFCSHMPQTLCKKHVHRNAGSRTEQDGVSYVTGSYFRHLCTNNNSVQAQIWENATGCLPKYMYIYIYTHPPIALIRCIVIYLMFVFTSERHIY